jgi:hypothetical protein
MMHQLSSNFTLFLRLFLPTMWVVFFGAVCAAGWFAEGDFVGPFPKNYFRLGSTLFLFSGLGFFIVTFWRLHRVDADPTHLFISDYFRTYRYLPALIDRIEIHHFVLFHLGKVIFTQKTAKGRSVWFLISPKRLKRFASYPDKLPLHLVNR